MPIVKTKPKGNFAAIQNATLRDNRLSIGALGMLAHLLSHNDSFKLSFKSLQKKFKIGRDKMNKIVRELKENGYLQHVAIQNEKGEFAGQEWYVYAESQNVNLT